LAYSRRPTDTLAPLFVESSRNQDMPLAGSVVMVLSSLTVIGTLISDILLSTPRRNGSVSSTPTAAS
jgi:hypothetical protein